MGLFRCGAGAQRYRIVFADLICNQERIDKSPGGRFRRHQLRSDSFGNGVWATVMSDSFEDGPGPLRWLSPTTAPDSESRCHTDFSRSDTSGYLLASGRHLRPAMPSAPAVADVPRRFVIRLVTAEGTGLYRDTKVPTEFRVDPLDAALGLSDAVAGRLPSIDCRICPADPPPRPVTAGNSAIGASLSIAARSARTGWCTPRHPFAVPPGRSIGAGRPRSRCDPPGRGPRSWTRLWMR